MLNATSNNVNKVIAGAIKFAKIYVHAVEAVQSELETNPEAKDGFNGMLPLEDLIEGYANGCVTNAENLEEAELANLQPLLEAVQGLAKIAKNCYRSAHPEITEKTLLANLEAAKAILAATGEDKADNWNLAAENLYHALHIAYSRYHDTAYDHVTGVKSTSPEHIAEDYNKASALLHAGLAYNAFGIKDGKVTQGIERNQKETIAIAKETVRQMANAAHTAVAFERAFTKVSYGNISSITQQLYKPCNANLDTVIIEHGTRSQRVVAEFMLASAKHGLYKQLLGEEAAKSLPTFKDAQDKANAYLTNACSIKEGDIITTLEFGRIKFGSTITYTTKNGLTHTKEVATVAISQTHVGLQTFLVFLDGTRVDTSLLTNLKA